MGASGAKLGCCFSEGSDDGRARVEAVEHERRNFHEEYQLGGKLGEGAFGCVYSARPCSPGNNSVDVAVKVFDLCVIDARGRRRRCIDDKLRRVVDKEVAILQLLPASQHIVQFHASFVNAGAEGLAYIVMERCTGVLLPLLEGTSPYTEASLQPIFRDMLTGIAACQEAGIVHRDVKPDNFLVSMGADPRGFKVKLCDFGLASRLRDRDSRELGGVFGTPPFMPPEMLAGTRYGAKVDVWALGAVAYVLLFGQWPYNPPASTAPSMKEAIRVGHPAPSFQGVGVSPQCVCWVRELLRRDPAERPSAAQALQHDSFESPWSMRYCLRGSLRSAKRVGAFSRRGHLGSGAATGLDRLLLELGRECRRSPKANACGESEASTSVDSDGRASSARAGKDALEK